MRNIAIFLTCSAAIIVLVAHLAAARQPSYQGIKLGAWLDTLYPRSAASVQQRELAEMAVREIGQDGLPWLVGWAAAKQGRLEKLFLQRMPETVICRSLRFWSPAPYLNAKAVAGLKVLGQRADPAIPQLLEKTRNAIDDGSAIVGLDALCAIGSEKSYDAVMSLKSTRHSFTEKFLEVRFLSKNPEMWGYLRTRSQQNGPANGSQPLRSETNQTPGAAGSRR